MRRRPRWALTVTTTGATVAVSVLLVPGNLPGASPAAMSPPAPSDERPPLVNAGAGANDARISDRLTALSPRVQRSPSATRPLRVPVIGTGEFEVAAAPRSDAVEPAAMTYTVEVEGGLPFPVAATARLVDATLASPRGWTTESGVAFQRVSGSADIRVLIASPATTDALCAPLLTRGRVSCRNGELVVLNGRRWASGTPDYRGFLRQYQHYVVNHEVGHALGYPHVACASTGDPAPVMAQQTYGLGSCERNAWPSAVG